MATSNGASTTESANADRRGRRRPQRPSSRADSQRGQAEHAPSESTTAKGAAGGTARRGRGGARSRGGGGGGRPGAGKARGSQEICFICANEIRFQAIGPCDHPTCHLCSLRLRSLYKTKACPYCKTEVHQVIYCLPKGRSYASFSPKELPFEDEDLGIQFESQEIQMASQDILRLRCQWRGCDFVAEQDWNELKKHVTDAHHMYLCDLCVRFKKSFAHEHRLFTKPQLTAHYRRGDKQGFPGHPSCDFCHYAFYDDDQLYEHCRDRHEQCHICVRSGNGRHHYYRNYQKLEEHFRKDHYLCPKPQCLENRFVVFESEIDLKAHMLEEHSPPGAGGRAATRQLRQIDIGLNIRGSRSRGHPPAHGPPRESSSAPSSDRETRGPSSMLVPPNFGQLSMDFPLPQATLNRTHREPSPALPAAPVPSDPSSTRSAVPSLSSIVQGGAPNRATTTQDWPALAGPSSSSGAPSARKGPKPAWGSSAPSLASRPIVTEIRSNQPRNKRKGKAIHTLDNNTAPLRINGESSAAERASSAQPMAGAADAGVGNSILGEHSKILQTVDRYFRHDAAKVAQFRRLATQLHTRALRTDLFLDALWQLMSTVPSITRQTTFNGVVNGLADLLEKESADFSQRLRIALHQYSLQKQQFPSLSSTVASPPGMQRSASAGTGRGGRVLVIKSSTKSKL
ncbi:hypothetical protein H4R35_005185 [Dimargaris xerosporica]|nr:hypothetical protein H4R35_005185 [Dimargaris xerosporica]